MARKRILLAEDDSITRTSVADVLRKEGYEVDEARDGIQAAELFANRRFDLVITDFVMPQLNGLKLITRVRAASPQTPIILMTPYLSTYTGKVILQGAAEFIEKPIEPDVLLATVKHLLHVSSAATVYRRKRGFQSWHFCSNCSAWPTNDYEERISARAVGELCNECEAKQGAGECRSTFAS